MNKNIDKGGITCSIFHAKNETEHFHQSIEFLFIIDGHIHVVVDNNEYRILSQEFLLINSSKMHYIYVDEDAIICRFNISYDMMKSVFEEDYIAFWCNVLTASDSGYDELLRITREIIRLRIQNDKRDGFRLMEQYGRLLNCLTRNYKIDAGRERTDADNNADNRIQEVISYINMNYNEPINLASLADEMFVSLSTLSRTFKKTTGVKFPDYVNRIRLHHAVDDLLNSNKSMTEIAVDNGFSSPSSFNRVFRDVYGTTPSQYKKSVRSTVSRQKEILTEAEESQVRDYLEEYHIKEENIDEIPLVDIYPRSDTQFRPISTRTVSVGAFYQLTNSSVQNQIRQMAEQLQLSYIRMWNIFSPRCMIAMSPEEKTLSFEQIDIVLDFLVSLHLHPFLDMTDHPECLIQNGRTLFFRRDDSMGFQNPEQWSYFLDKLMEHVVFRYGHNEVSQWIFELGDYAVQGGPDYYDDGVAYYENNIYADVFEASYRIIKSHCPNTMVGGPDWVLDGKKLEIKQHFTDWERIGLYPDFYSVHVFPYVGMHADGAEQGRNMDPDFMKNQIQEITARLQEINAPKRPLYVTELTTILSNRNAMNDHLARGTNVLRVTNLYQDYVDMICFWVATDRLSLHYAPAGILHGGSGLMSKDGIPKPSYFSLYFLAKLGTQLLARGDGYMAVRNGPNNIYILCYNYKKLIYDYKYEEENIVNVYNVDSMFENTDNRSVRFMVHGLEPGREYVVKRHMVNQDYGSIMDEWRRLGFEPEMRGNDIAYLKNICIPRIQMEHKVAEEGRIFLEADMKPHEMLLLHIYR